MINAIFHAVLFANLLGLAVLVAYATGERLFADDEVGRRKYWLACGALLALNLALVLLVAAFLPSMMVTPDGRRYLFEIREIAMAPWEWNPITGSGPYYQVTAKMGMSYLYGVILFLHQVDSLGAVLALNVFFSFLTGIAVFFLTRAIADDLRPAIVAMLFTAVFPEMAFWTARVARENLSLLFLPAFVYCCVRAFQTFRPKYLAWGVVLLFAILLTRAQLALFGVLILVYFAVASLRSGPKARVAGALAVGTLSLYLAYPVIEAQIARAVGRSFLQYTTFDPSFWMQQGEPLVQNIGSLLTPVARGSNGALGLLIAPFMLLTFALVGWVVIRFRAIFGERAVVAGLLLFLSALFLAMLAVTGAINIRFRSTVAPLLLPVLAVTVVHLWDRWSLPRIRLL